MKTSKCSYLGLSLVLMLTTARVWGADGSLDEAAESRSRPGNSAKGSLIEGRLVTTYDGTKQEQDWYAVTLAQAFTVGWVVFTHGGTFHDGGWFDTSKGKPQVQVQAVTDGPWTTVGELKDYPATTATDNNNIKDNTQFACTLATPVTALTVRVIGRPACGDNPEQSFSSSAGLKVYRSANWMADNPLQALETKLKMGTVAKDVVPGPNQDRASISNWLADMKKWRELKLADIQYYGTEYDRPELKWCQRAFIQPQMMVEDRYFFDVETGKYTVDRYLNDLEERYGGIDAVLVWAIYPNIGIDNRNQFDQFRALPGGVPALKQMVADFHRRNVKVLFPVMPWWQTGSRDEGVSIPVAIARDMKAIGADGVNGDTMQSMGGDYTFRTESDKSGNILAFEPEGAVAAGEKELPWINMGWGYWFTPAKSMCAIPPVSKYKWLEPRHMVNICDRWARDRNQDLQSAFFNGTGYESWESVWCIWNGITPRDGEALRRIATIMRAYPDLLISRDWEPHTPTLQKGVFASRFPGAHETLWTIINRYPFQIDGPQLQVPSSPGVRYFDLWHGVELKPVQEGQEAVLSFEMEGYGFGSVLAVSGAPDPKLNTLLAKMKKYSAKRLVDFSDEWKFLPQTQVPIAATAPAKEAPPGMTLIPAGSFEFKVEGIEVEGGNQIGTDVQYPWEDSPRRYHRQPVSLKSFFIDTYPVSNAQFKKFVEAAKYHPRDDYNFLKDWKDGAYPEGWGNKPVTWVSLEDARAYAAWAGKRLPHETEWQYAAQGTDGRLYPWGNEMNTEAIPPACTNKMLRGPTDVDAFPKGASPFGVMDLVGNVWQWTDEYHDEHSRGGIVRGGSYFKPQGSGWYFPNKIELNTHGKLLLMAPSKDRAGTLGFRCVVDAIVSRQTQAEKDFEDNLRKKLTTAEKPNLRGRYKADFESLKQYRIPGWYQDGKFGIFITWGIFSVPAINDCWYGYWMYRDSEDMYDDSLRRHPYAQTRSHHLEYYGATDKFGYKDFIPLFKAEYFDAAAWVKLFRDAGAKYVVPVAEFHDMFPMYDSSLTRWNAVNMGPRRDVVGEIRKEALANGMKFGVSSHRLFHHNESYYVHNGKNDIDDPQYWDLYWKPFADPKVEDQLYIDESLARTVELVNKYQPDLLWFDAGTYKPQFKEFCKTIAAHYYNQAEAWGKPGVVLNYKWGTYPEGTAVLDLEASKMDAVHEPFWQTDMSMAETWSYSSEEKYKTAEQLIHTLIDIVSKNGSLLLNIAPRADGRIPLEQQDRLLAMGAWLKVNGEAIYGTRPFKNYGEGPTKSTTEMVQSFTAEDIRYTTKGKTVYAAVMGWPSETVKLTLPSVKSKTPDAKVALLGYDKPLKYQVKNRKMSVEFPKLEPFQRACKYAYVLKLEGFEVE